MQEPKRNGRLHVMFKLFMAFIAIFAISFMISVSLKGSTDLNANKENGRDKMFLETLVVGDLDSNCYLVAAEHGAEAIVIDPGGDAQVILDTIAAMGLDVKYIILTHGHWDHFAAVADLAKKTGAVIAIHKLDKGALDDPRQSLAYMFGEEQKESLDNIIELTDGQVLKIGELEAEILHTPGHTQGSITVRIADRLFTGDLLFYRSIGRTDFPGGSHESLLKSVRDKIFKYPDHVKVYPGHGPSTSVGEERRENPFFN